MVQDGAEGSGPREGMEDRLLGVLLPCVQGSHLPLPLVTFFFKARELGLYWDTGFGSE